MTGTTEILVPDGKVNPGPPLDPELGPTPVDVQDVIDGINDQAAAFDGTEIPVTVEYDSNDSFSIEVGVSPMMVLIKDEIRFDTNSGGPQEDFAADMFVEQLKKVAEQKSSNLFPYDLKNTSKEVAGMCTSSGVTIKGEDARTFEQRIDGSDFNGYFSDE